MYFGKVIPVKLGDLGEGTKEATLKQWFVKPGTEVKEFEDLCEVITDKLVAKIPSTYGGKVTKLNYKPDEICQVGQPLLEMEVGDDVKVKEEIKKEEHAPAEHKPEPPKAEAPKVEAAPKAEAPKHEPAPGGKILATPTVRALAMEMKVDLKKVVPTGKGGRITKNDLLKYAESMQAKPAAPVAEPTPVAPAPAPVATGQDKSVKLSGIRRAMVKSMTDALSIPPYNIQEEVFLDKLKHIRKVYTDANPKNKLTYLPFFIKAFSQAMLEFPLFNALVSPMTDKEGYITEYIEKAEHNISVAVDSPAGLLVPNLKSVQSKSIIQINEELKGLIERARKGSLTQADLTDGTFTFSNIGNIGGLTGAPMIFRPQVAIAATGRIRVVPDLLKLPNGEYTVVPRDSVIVTMSCDHRIIDGATGVRFLNLVKKYIENLDTLLLTLK